MQLLLSTASPPTQQQQLAPSRRVQINRLRNNLQVVQVDLPRCRGRAWRSRTSTCICICCRARHRIHAQIAAAWVNFDAVDS
jgi:hypothetical protein